ncbi:MAG: hypothetical protein HY286_01375 [Planctomycetes bacterium]|nr:hypothetical protein [Planctomycetota bacterium]
MRIGTGNLSAFERPHARQLAFAIFATIVANVMSVPGPDFLHYFQWGRAAVGGDIFEIRSSTLSPIGIPLSQWSHGPGFFFGFGEWIAGRWLDPIACMRIPLAALQFIFYWSAAGIIRIAARGNLSYYIFGLNLLILGTNAAYYTKCVASETIALSSLSVMLYFVISRSAWRLLDSAVVAAAFGFLIIARVQVAPYGIVCLLIPRLRDNPPANYRLVCALSAVAGVWAAVQIGIVNYWMTGIPWRSPYIFGDEFFQSVSLTNTHLWAILFHPLHGWFATHPFIMIGLASMIFFTARTRNARARVLGIATIVTIGLNIAVNASWYCWWLGDSFGMRGLVCGSLIIVPAFIYIISRAERAPAAISVVASTICCAWSCLLMWREIASPFRWADLIHLQSSVLADPLFSIPAIGGILTVAALWIRDRAKFGIPIVVPCCEVLSALTIGYIFGNLTKTFALQTPLAAYGAEACGLVLAIAAALFIHRIQLRAPRENLNIHPHAGRRAIERVVGAAAAAMFLFITFAFARLALNTFSKLSDPYFAASRINNISKNGAVSIDEITGGGEFVGIPGFDADTRQVREFILRERERIK